LEPLAPIREVCLKAEVGLSEDYGQIIGNVISGSGNSTVPIGTCSTATIRWLATGRRTKNAEQNSVPYRPPMTVQLPACARMTSSS
jgi:hypothetical protein